MEIVGDVRTAESVVSESEQLKVSAPVAAPTKVRDVRPSFRGAWFVLQLVPSPGVAVGDSGAHGTMTWQVTPFLYSWAMDSRLRPTRYFVVEPIVRQSGSVEVFLSPSYVGGGVFEENWGLRSGLRGYLPFTERGDGLSGSLGVSAYWFGDVVRPSCDLGIYTLFGGLGLLTTFSPRTDDNRVEWSLRVRYF